MKRILATIACCAAATLLPTAAANQPLSAPEVNVTIAPGKTQQLSISGEDASLSDNILWLNIAGSGAGELQIGALCGTASPTIEAVWADGSPLQLTPQNGMNNSRTYYSFAQTVLPRTPQNCLAKITFSESPTNGTEIRVLAAQPAGSQWDSLLTTLQNFWRDFNWRDIPQDYLIGGGIGLGLLLLLLIIRMCRGGHSGKRKPVCTLSCKLGTKTLCANELTDAGGITIGRSDECDWQLSETSISREHGRLTMKSGKLLYTDLASANGTYRNNAELKANHPVELQNGDMLELGRISIQVTLH